MREINALHMMYYCPVGGTFWVGAGTIVFNDLGGVINSFGGSGISIFGTKRVNGFPHPTRNKKESATRYFIVLPPFSCIPSSFGERPDLWDVRRTSWFVETFGERPDLFWDVRRTLCLFLETFGEHRDLFLKRSANVLICLRRSADVSKNRTFAERLLAGA